MNAFNWVKFPVKGVISPPPYTLTSRETVIIQQRSTATGLLKLDFSIRSAYCNVLL